MMQAMQVAQHVKKGMQLAIGGHLKQSKWLDRTTGGQRESVRVGAGSSIDLASDSLIIMYCCSSAAYAVLSSAVPRWANFDVSQVVAEYLMVVDASHGMLEGSAASGSGRTASSAPRKAAERSPRIAREPLRLYNEGHPPHAIAQMLVSSS